MHLMGYWNVLCHTEKAQRIVTPNKGASLIQELLVTQLEHVSGPELQVRAFHLCI